MEYRKIKDKAQLEKALERQNWANVELEGECTGFCAGFIGPYYYGTMNNDAGSISLIVPKYAAREGEKMPLEAAVLKLAAKHGLKVSLHGKMKKSASRGYIIEISGVKLEEIMAGEY